MSEIITVGEQRALHFRLREGHTLQSVRDAAALANEHDLPFFCRRLRHKWETIGDVYIPDEEEDFWGFILATIASMDTDKLVKCERCGTVKIGRRY